MQTLRILFQNDHLVAVDKPAGLLVHRLEDERHRSREKPALQILRDQLGRHVFPIHRLDRATSGVLLFALSPEAAGAFARTFQTGTVIKTYIAVVRGEIEASGVIDRALDDKPSVTRFERLGGLEVPFPNSKFQTSRYSLVRLTPETGRTHQIRRHLNGHGHPLIGDTLYGKREHNRIFKGELGIQGLLLKCLALRFPKISEDWGSERFFRARYDHRWHRVFDLFGVCPLALEPRECDERPNDLS